MLVAAEQLYVFNTEVCEYLDVNVLTYIIIKG